MYNQGFGSEEIMSTFLHIAGLEKSTILKLNGAEQAFFSWAVLSYYFFGTVNFVRYLQKIYIFSDILFVTFFQLENWYLPSTFSGLLLYKRWV